MAKAEVSAVKAAGKAVVKAVSGLHPDEALAVLGPFYAEARQGLRRRVLLAARIALMRKAMVAPRRAVVVAVPVPVAEAEVVDLPPAPPSPPEPKPLSKGRIMAINLDDLSSLLAEPVETAPKPAGEPVPEFAALDWGEVAAVTASEVGQGNSRALDEAAAEEGEAVAAKSGKASRGKKRGAVVAIKDGDTLADSFAALAEVQAAEVVGAGVAVPAVGMMVDPMAAFAEFEEAGDPTITEITPKEKAAVVEAGVDLAALEAARVDGTAAGGTAAGGPKPLAIDLSAQFAQMGDGD